MAEFKRIITTKLELLAVGLYLSTDPKAMEQ
jgi:hypothetical protein